MAPSPSPDHEHAPVRRRTGAPSTPIADAGADAHPLLTLQRQVGNAQIARMLAQREETPAPDEEEEPEAEAVQAKHDASLQREETPAPDEEEPIQASPEVGLEGGPVSAGLADQINAARGGGAPLDSGMQGEMEGAFGTSFAGVQVHSGPTAQQLNHSISAKAFTTGNDIFLGEGASASDRSLMAHELTHVVQQREMDHSGPMSVGPAGDSYEQQADAAATSITSGAAPAQRQSDEEP